MDFLEFDEPLKPHKHEKEETSITFETNFELETEDKIAPKIQLVRKSGKYETPFTRDDDSQEKSTFDFLELKEKKKKTGTHTREWVKCPNCGTLNLKGSDFCVDCQMELIIFRQLDLDQKRIKVVLKFPNSTKYKFCQVCGAANQIDAEYCKDCMDKLK